MYLHIRVLFTIILGLAGARRGLFRAVSIVHRSGHRGSRGEE
jgi:hypothetical protein